MKIKISLLIVLSFLVGCKTSKLPSVKYSSYEMQISQIYENNTIQIKLYNQLHCPVRFWLSNTDKTVQDKLNELSPLLLRSKSDTTLMLNNIIDYNKKLTARVKFGSLSKKIDTIKLALPFPKNKEYRILQGNNTNFTHNSDYSRYAIDFDLKTNDTICAATSGYVIGVIDKYEFGGSGQEWQPFGNFITVFEPNSGLYTQYVHLVKNGSLIQIGDEILVGQAIALSGNTGQSTTEHLHFNCLIPTDRSDGLKSIPIEFSNGYKGVALKRGDKVKN